MQLGKFEINTMLDAFRLQRGNPTTERVGELLEGNLKFAKDKKGELHVYDNGLYRLVGNDISTCYMELIKPFGMEWTSKRDKEVEIFLTKRAPELLEKPDANIINLKNGLYFIAEDKFEYHHEVDHSWYLTDSQIPVMYDPKATCEEVEKFMTELLPEGPDILFDIYGICATSDVRQHKAIVIKGGGNNGKSVYLYGLRQFIGHTNCATNTIHSICDPQDKFVNSSLIGKLVNAGDDTKQDVISFTDNLKSVISGNPIRSEQKYKDSYSANPYCKLIFSTNHDLVFNDHTIGMAKRIMEIPFRATFQSNAIKERQLQLMFEDPFQLSGIFNKIKKRIKLVLENQLGFDASPELETILTRYTVVPNDVQDWLTTNLAPDVNSVLDAKDLWTNYCLTVTNPCDQLSFGRYLKTIFPDTTYGMRRVFGQPSRCYTGVRIVGKELIDWLGISRKITEAEIRESLKDEDTNE